MGTLSRAGQSALRPVTPGSAPGLSAVEGSPKSAINADAAIAAFPELPEKLELTDDVTTGYSPTPRKPAEPAASPRQPLQEEAAGQGQRSDVESKGVAASSSSGGAPERRPRSSPRPDKEPEPAAAAAEEDDKATVLVRRASATKFGRNGLRRLTVDCNKRLVGDHIADSSCGADGACVSRQHPAQAMQTPGKVMSVWGKETTTEDKFGPFFAQKSLHFDGDISKMKHRVGMMSHRGHKPEIPNQDDFFVLARAESVLLGVLDGHGPDGHEVAHFAQQRLPTRITEALRQDAEAWEKAVSSSMEDICSEAKKELPNKAEYSGSTVSIAMIDRASPSASVRLRSAFLGDSIVVTARRKKKGASWEVTTLTDIHRPDRPDEAVRIEKCGGQIQASDNPGEPSARLLTPEWNLAMSRSFGDFHAVQYGLSSEPEIGPQVELEADYQHLILACSDGVWDVIPPAQAVQFVGKFAPEEAQTAVEKLVSKAQFRWQEISDVVDDITALLIWPGFNDADEKEDAAVAVSRPEDASKK